MQSGRFLDSLHVRELVDGNAEFRVYMPGRNLIVATRLNMRIDADKNRIAAAKTIAKLLQHGKVIYIQMNAELLGFQYFRKSDAIGRIQYPVRREAGMQSKLCFINADAIQRSAELTHVPQYVNVTQGLTGIEETCGETGESVLQTFVLPGNDSGVVDIERSAVSIGKMCKRGVGHEATKVK